MIPAGYTVLLLCGPLAAVAAVWLAERIGIPYPVLLVGVGALFYLTPWVGTPQLAPDVVFYVFLPPLIYYAANSIAPDELRANARTIGLLAVGLVVATTAAVAGVLVGVAGLPLAVALVAGVVVAPTDPVSATSVFRRLEAPQRLSTIVEAEGLTNDGTALVLYQGAIGVAVAGSLHPGRLAVTLLVAPAGGAALGLAIGWLTVQVRRRMAQPVLEITLSLATPYFTYAGAQALHLSGILATVAVGIYVGSHISHIYAPDARLQAFAFLDVLVFLLNAVLFMLVGMQLARVVHGVPGRSRLHLVAVIAAVVAVVFAVRMIWVLFWPAALHLLDRAGSQDLWRNRVILGWAGLRGGLSLAAALAIPLHRGDGSPFPERGLVILVTAGVIVGSLAIQGLSLPWLLNRLGLKPDDFQMAENKAWIKAARAALAALNHRTDGGGADDATESVRALYENRVRRLQRVDGDGQASDDAGGDSAEMQRYLALRRELLSVERSVISDLRREGRINAVLWRSMERHLDLLEARLHRS